MAVGGAEAGDDYTAGDPLVHVTLVVGNARRQDDPLQTHPAVDQQVIDMPMRPDGGRALTRAAARHPQPYVPPNPGR